MDNQIECWSNQETRSFDKKWLYDGLKISVDIITQVESSSQRFQRFENDLIRSYGSKVMAV